MNPIMSSLVNAIHSVIITLFFLSNWLTICYVTSPYINGVFLGHADTKLVQAYPYPLCLQMSTGIVQLYLNKVNAYSRLQIAMQISTPTVLSTYNGKQMKSK